MKCPDLLKDPLYACVETEIKNKGTKKKTYGALYTTAKVLVFASGAIISLIVGLEKESELFKNAGTYLMGLSVAITFLTALEGFFDLGDKAMGYDLFLCDLRHLRDEMCFDFSESPEVYAAKRREYFEKYTKIMEAQKAIIKGAYEERPAAPGAKT